MIFKKEIKAILPIRLIRALIISLRTQVFQKIKIKNHFWEKIKTWTKEENKNRWWEDHHILKSKCPK